jgi:hypothetical protein
MIKCKSNKKVYLTTIIAEEALIGARTRFDYGKQTGPVGAYQCDECGYYHLTSQGAINPKLAEYLASGKFKIEKEAQQWEHKFKKW